MRSLTQPTWLQILFVPLVLSRASGKHKYLSSRVSKYVPALTALRGHILWLFSWYYTGTERPYECSFSLWFHGGYDDVNEAERQSWEVWYKNKSPNPSELNYLQEWTSMYFTHIYSKLNILCNVDVPVMGQNVAFIFSLKISTVNFDK